MDDRPENVIPLPTINREPAPVGPPPLDFQFFATFLRRIEQDPWAVQAALGGEAIALEWEVGHPCIRLRLDLAGEWRGIVRVFLVLAEDKRGRLNAFGKPGANDDDVMSAIRNALRFVRVDLGDAIMRHTRAVAG